MLLRTLHCLVRLWCLGSSPGALSDRFAASIPSIPFDWLNTFKLEERFGFNKSTKKLWVIDKFKSTIIGFVIGYPLLALLIFLVGAAGPLWWVWGFAVFFIFQLVMVVAYPMFIMPLFNKLEPMEEGELKTRLSLWPIALVSKRRPSL